MGKRVKIITYESRGVKFPSFLSVFNPPVEKKVYTFSVDKDAEKAIKLILEKGHDWEMHLPESVSREDTRVWHFENAMGHISQALINSPKRNIQLPSGDIIYTSEIPLWKCCDVIFKERGINKFFVKGNTREGGLVLGELD